MREFACRALFSRALVERIWEGTSEIQWTIIACKFVRTWSNRTLADKGQIESTQKYRKCRHVKGGKG